MILIHTLNKLLCICRINYDNLYILIDKNIKQ